MYEQVEKPKENKSRAVADSVAQKKNSRLQGFGFVDNRPESIVQRKIQKKANDGEYVSSRRSVAQRIVESVQSSGTTMYRSTFDPGKYFGTHALAQAHENACITNRNFPKVSARSPTAFTFAQTPSTSAIGTGGSKQGPHVWGEAGMNQGYMDMEEEEVASVVAQVPTPVQAKTDFEKEMVDHSPGPEKTARIARFMKTYTQLYGLLGTLDPSGLTGAKKRSAVIARKKILKMVMNMEAHGTYAYQLVDPTKHPKWKSMIGGKGERAYAPKTKLYDDNAKALFKDKARFDKRHKQRGKVLDKRKKANVKKK